MRGAARALALDHGNARVHAVHAELAHATPLAFVRTVRTVPVVGVVCDRGLLELAASTLAPV